MTEHNNVTISRELLRQIEESLESRCGTNAPERREILPQLRELLEQPAVATRTAVEQEPVAFGRWHEDGYMDMVFLDEKECREYLNDDENPVALYTAPQAQQPPRVGPGMSVEQTLEQWEHDFNNPMTPEQQVDWVKREREFASAQAQQPAPVQKPDRTGMRYYKNDQCTADSAESPACICWTPEAQQPRKAVKLTDEEVEVLWTGDEWGHFVFARAVEQAVLRKNGVTE